MIPQLGESVSHTLSVLVPVGKGAALGMTRSLGNRAVKMGMRAGTGEALGAATSGAAYGIRRLLKKRRKKRRS